MKSHVTHSKAKMGGRAVSSQQVAFELKHRVILSLNKLADRDTIQIGVEELEKTVDGLGPEGIAPFLSCIIETDSEQKSTVRRECVKIMGMLARFHGDLLGPYLGKMVASILKRLKDTDTIVRDACVETVGMFASNIISCGGGGDGGGPFAVLTKPLFEALGEQNRYVQAGAALCLARVIDDSSRPLLQILQPMLNRVIKLLKNPHFMAKAALIELVRSIIQVRAASTDNVLSAAITSILEALKNTDWTTRKAASVALASLAVNCASYLSSFKPTCVESLESCRFDKVKPVRDAVLHALQCWKNLRVIDCPDASEAGSSTKENFSQSDYLHVTAACDGDWKSMVSMKPILQSSVGGNSTGVKHQRSPLGIWKTSANNVRNHERPKPNDWHIDISVPRARSFLPADDTHHEESEGSCITKAFETRTCNTNPGSEINSEDDDDKPGCSFVSDLVSGSFETKHATAIHGYTDEADSALNHQSVAEKTGPESQICPHRSRDKKNSDYTIMNVSTGSHYDYCQQTSSELYQIKKQLSEIESRQANLLDLLQVFIGNSMNSLSTLQSKVHNLEYAVDKITQCISQDGKPTRGNHNVSTSPKLSTSTPRTSVDTNYRRPSVLSMRNSKLWEETSSSKSRSVRCVNEGADSRKDPSSITKKSVLNGAQKNSGRGCQSTGIGLARKVEDASGSICIPKGRFNASENNNSLWKRIKDFMCAEDNEAAYMEALCTGDDLVLIELMDKTGPILEKLSDEIINEILCTLAVHILDQRFLGSIIPWLQQVVDLSTVHGSNYILLSAKARRELLLSIQEAASMDFSSPTERASLTQLAVKLRHLWCEENARSTCNLRKHLEDLAEERKY